MSTAQPEPVQHELQAARASATQILHATVGHPVAETVLCVIACDIAEPQFATTEHLTLAPLGYPHVTAQIAAASLRVDAQAWGLPLQDGRVDGPAAVMGLQVREHTLAACGFLLLPHEPDVAVLDRLADKFVEGTARPGSRAIVAASDLSATLTERSPGYVVSGADEFDREVMAAVETHNLERLRQTAGSATTYMARGWSSLYLIVRLASLYGLRPGAVTYHAPCGVGHVCATYV